ncbi:MAG TPA: cation diffusion facilitator family transporter [Egibacteraceae bacterium]|nr:cation diffusion facilitator family transporter [Egibacteraceae bacterium]
MTAHHDDAPGAGTPAQRRALRLALGLTAAFLVAEALGGLAFRSLALLADAGHMLTDVGAISLSLAAFRLAARPASPRHSYGFQRAELLAALANGALLIAVSAWVTVEAIGRLADPPQVRGAGVLAVAATGLGINLVVARLLARSRNGSLNVHSAYLHALSDALGSIGAIIAGLAVLLFSAHWVDPAVSLLIVVLIGVSAARLLREVVHVLLEGTPRGLDPEEVAAALHAEPSVDRVHHLHVWRLSSDSIAASGHVVAENVETLHEAQLLGDRLKRVLAERFGIDHATLELECHDCRGQQIVPLADTGRGEER